MWSRIVILCAVIITDIIGAEARAIQSLTKRATSPPTKSGFSLTWSEEFEGSFGQLPNTDVWQIDTGHSYPGGPSNWGTGEIQSYTSSTSNIRLDGSGNLNIIPQTANGGWTSARIETKRADFVCAPGGQMIIEGSIMLPDTESSLQSGIWPAFWALGKAYRDTNFQGWPMCGEWDILEAANGKSTVHGTLHCGTNPGGPCQETNGLSATTSFSRGVYNTYSIRIDRTASIWQNEYLVWSINGREYSRVTGGTVGDYTTWENLAHKPLFILLNVAVGGAFPDALAGTRTPNSQTAGGDASRMAVDWVAVYNSNGNMNPATTAMPSSTSTPTTTRTSSATATSTLSPSNFPPGQSLQCVTAAQASGISSSAGEPYTSAANYACEAFFPNGSGWIDKGYQYQQVISINGRSVSFSLTIHIGGFTLQGSYCVQQFMRIFDSCASGNPLTTYGGCAYTSDNNLQSCILPS